MLKNFTKNLLISKKITKVNNTNRFIGLIGKSKPESLLIKTRFGIHTFFLKFTIDIIILDKKNRVVFLRENIKPNSIVFWNPKYDTVLELPKESIKKSKTKKGDILDINFL